MIAKFINASAAYGFKGRLIAVRAAASHASVQPHKQSSVRSKDDNELQLWKPIERPMVML